MNVVDKIITALRGGVSEAGEAIVDAQALRILDQEIRDADSELKRSRDSLASIIARQKLAEEKAARLRGTIEEHEGYARKALAQDDEPLALEVAARIARLETELAGEDEAARGFAASADELRAAIRGAEDDLRHMKQQVDVVRATEAVQRAQESVSERHGGTNAKLRTAMDSLERIKERQALRAASGRAARELADEAVGCQSSGGQSLDARLEAAGIKPADSSADAVLARLKKRD